MSARAAVLVAAALAACGARSELQPTPQVSDRLVCGLTPVAARAGRGQELVAAAPPALIRGLRWEVVAGAAAATLEPRGDRARFWTGDEGDYRVAVTAADGSRCEIDVRVRGTAPGARCDETAAALASAEVTLTGSAQSVSPIVRSRWSVESAPPGSSWPAPQRRSIFDASFVPDVVGDYLLRFEVEDAQGERDACVTRLRADAAPGLRVELWWDPPGRPCPTAEGASCDRADLDLHLLREGGEGWGSAADCHFANCNAAAGQSLAWGERTDADDPRLLRDDVSGHGPEVVAITAPEPRRYRVGVHYFAARGAGAQNASVALYCGGVSRVIGPLSLPADAPRGGALWVAADITVHDGACVFAPVVGARGAAVLAWDDTVRTQGP